MNKISFTLLSLLLVSAALSAGSCPKEKCGKCMTDDTKSKMWCTQCFKSKVTGTGTDTTCEGNETGIVGCNAVELNGTAQKCLLCDEVGGNFAKDANKSDCSVKCVKETHYFNENTFACVVRVNSKDNCGKPSHKSDECEECKAGYALSANKCEPLSVVTNCRVLNNTDKAKCAECMAGHWLENDTTCTPMTMTNKDKCAAGSSATVCTKCVPGWWLKNDNICYDLVATGNKPNCMTSDKADTPTCTGCMKGYVLKADATCVELKGCAMNDFTVATGFCKRCKVPEAFATAADTTPAKVGTDYHQVCTKSAKNGSSAKIIGSIISMIALLSIVF